MKSSELFDLLEENSHQLLQGIHCYKYPNVEVGFVVFDISSYLLKSSEV